MDAVSGRKSALAAANAMLMFTPLGQAVLPALLECGRKLYREVNRSLAWDRYLRIMSRHRDPDTVRFLPRFSLHLGLYSS